MTHSPTRAQYTAYEQMFRHFNRRLFAGALTPALLNFSRKSKASSFFEPNRWNDTGKVVKHGISLNPAKLRALKPIGVASTVVYEMVRLWQQDFGKPSRRGYHNAQWAAKMDEVGLTPSSTGEMGGARVGQKMSFFVAPRGRFSKAFAVMPPEYLLPWSWEESVRGSAKSAASKNKVKYTCGPCEWNVWGQPGVPVVCGDCGKPFTVVV